MASTTDAFAPRSSNNWTMETSRPQQARSNGVFIGSVCKQELGNLDCFNFVASQNAQMKSRHALQISQVDQTLSSFHEKQLHHGWRTVKRSLVQSVLSARMVGSEHRSAVVLQQNFGNRHGVFVPTNSNKRQRVAAIRINVRRRRTTLQCLNDIGDAFFCSRKKKLFVDLHLIIGQHVTACKDFQLNLFHNDAHLRNKKHYS